jgi:hypothetical protein
VAIHEFAFVPGLELQALSELLRQLQPGHHICMQAWTAAEAYLEVRRVSMQLQARTSHHGAPGEWAAVTFDKALDFLSLTAPHINGNSPQFTGSYSITPNDHNAS